MVTAFVDVFEETETEVDVEAAFVGFVDHNDRVLSEERVKLDFAEQNAVRHKGDVGAGGGDILKTNVVTNLITNFRFHHTGDAAGDACGGDAAGLSDSDTTFEI